MKRGDLAKDAIIGFLVGVVLFLGACLWDARLEARQDALSRQIADRQDDLAKAIAERQDGLSRDLANQAEVLENTRFVRQLAVAKGVFLKPFANINLRGAELGGLDLSCTNLENGDGCANFHAANLQEANLSSAQLTGAYLTDADLRHAKLTETDFWGAELSDADLGGVIAEGPANFGNALFLRTVLVQARLERAVFVHARLTHTNATEAVDWWRLPRGKSGRVSFQAGPAAEGEVPGCRDDPR